MSNVTAMSRSEACGFFFIERNRRKCRFRIRPVEVIEDEERIAGKD